MDNNTKEVLSFAVELGDSLLRNGAEVYRVEESITKILDAYDIEDGDVYVLTNGIFATAEEQSIDAASIVRHVPLCPTHLGRIAAINQLGRDVCDRRVTIEEAWQRLEQCSGMPTATNWQLAIAGGIGSAGFAYLFGGSVWDSLAALLIGFVVQGSLNLMAAAHTSKTVTNVLASALAAALAMACVLVGLPLHSDKIIIGDIMPMVPGIALTNGIRDFVNGDYLSGTIRLIDALLTAFCIAVGVGIVITVVTLITGGAPL